MEEGSSLVDMGQLMARIIAMQSQLNGRVDDIDGKIENRLDELDDKIIDIQNRLSLYRTKEAYLKSQGYTLRNQAIEDLEDVCLS
ncbi:hypothetical protein M9H77_12346 [Catharanthus roseus]|uniref:Uncharacterized protein n=1 Tax=Catharanthus roseus TaxID=4058 RepID=A0ACC0BHB6_CATRO|nr:hypothetical protein M9H77_12346 [Catharanthus roseus]